MSAPSSSAETHAEELDLVIQGMQGQADEERLGKVLHQIGGVQAARIIPEGAWLRYEPARVTKEAVCDAVRKAGFKVTLFQDSLSNETHNVSQR